MKTIETESITASEVHNALKECLYKDEEIDQANPQPPDNAVIVEGILSKFAFHPERLEAQREQVKAWLRQLPDPFQEKGGGGMSFLNACMTKNGEQWGEHPSMDALFSLAQGLKLAKLCLPRAMWSALPGGMPYYSISNAVNE